MKADTFSALVDSMNEALEHAQGKKSLRTVTLPRPFAPFTGLAVKRVRTRLRASQSVFASYLNVSTKLVQAWEAGRRRPEGPALVLLHIADTQPGVLEVLRQRAAGKHRRQGPAAQTSRHVSATR